MKRVILIIAILLMVVRVGCRKPPSSAEDRSSASTKSYDPQSDPLVNPEAIFQPRPTDPGAVDSQATLRLHLQGNPNTLNPIFVSSIPDFIANDAIHQPLFLFDAQMNWQVNEALVASCSESDDLTRFIVTLRDGLTWQDGHPFTACDVVFSWEQIRDERVPCISQKRSVKPIIRCEALDDLTVVYEQAESLPIARLSLQFPILAHHLFEKEKAEHPDLRSGDYYLHLSRHPVGNGPYRLIDWIDNDRLVLQRWEGYAGTKPAFERLVLRIVPDDTLALMLFEQGQLDAITSLSPRQFAADTQREAFEQVGYLVLASQWSFDYIGWNMDGSNPFFTDLRVRQAMSHAVHVATMIEKIFYNLAVPSSGLYHHESWAFNPQVQPLAFDPEASARLLDEAGWGVDGQDGWRYKKVAGRRHRFTFTLLLPSSTPHAQPLADILQQDLRKLGVQMDIESLEWSSFLVRLREHDFDAVLSAWNTGTDPDHLSNLWRADTGTHGRNYVSYENRRVEDLFEQGRREPDRVRRRRIYQEIHARLYADQPYTWICSRPVLAVVNRRIRGVTTSPRGLHLFYPAHLAWWTPVNL